MFYLGRTVFPTKKNMKNLEKLIFFSDDNNENEIKKRKNRSF